MVFNCPDINTFKADLDNNISAAGKLKKENHATVKIQSLLNITVYTLATRFLEGSVKIIIYNCAIIRGDNANELKLIESDLKGFNNPKYVNIKEAFIKHIGFAITQGLGKGRFSKRDISLMDEIILNRHRNVHASHEPTEWYSVNVKDILLDFPKEYPSLLNILTYLDSINFDSATKTFKD